MTTADFIDRFKKHINIIGMIHVAYAEAALEKVLINRYIANNTLIMNCLILICSAETQNMCRIINGVYRVCQIEFTISDL